MRTQRLFVERLFGIFDHEIPMKTDDRVTIIHGPNGFGKTTILRMVDGLFNARYAYLRAIPFREFRVDIEDGRSLVVENPTTTSASSSWDRNPVARAAGTGIS